MGLILKAGGSFVPAPEGQFSAVCVDVVDLGVVETTWKGQKRERHKCRLVFEIDETMDDESGKRFIVQHQFTASLSDKASLRKFLESWRGKPFTPEELKGFDTEQLIGAPAVLQVVHATKEGTVYANINSVMKLMKGLPRLAPSSGYTRVKDRTNGDGLPHDEAPPPDDDDQVPF